MAKLSYKEIKAILLIHSKADYSQKKKIKTLLGIVDGKKMLYSPVGLQYRSALEKIAEGEMPQTCCFCHGPVTGGKGVICEDCVSKLTAVVVKATRENEERIRREREEAKAGEELEATEESKAGEELEAAEESKAAEESVEAVEPEETEKPAEPAAAEEPYEAETPEEGVVEPVEQAEPEEVIEEPEEISVSAYDPQAERFRNGRFYFVLFVLLLLIGGTVFTVVRFRNYNAAKLAAAERASNATEIYPFVGGDYEDISRILGKSQAVVDENVRFFDKSCMTVMYNVGSGKVTYVDQNGVGPLKTTLFGVCVGMTKDEVKFALEQFGLKKPVSNADNTIKYEYSKGLDHTLLLGVSYVNDKVEFVSLQVKSGN
ncbi:MAG: hypothetical protein K5888_08560 [Lachnospiraceae bacterium]|nr:hypothetical protein [Lachnospiraceae bacterium]